MNKRINRREFVKQTAAISAGIGGGLYLTQSQPSDARASATPLKPPGALPGNDFASTCIRCLKCVDACPNHALVPLPLIAPGGRGGTPTLHPRRASCMLCSMDDGEYLRCTEACPSGALQLIKKNSDDILEKVAIGTAEIDFDLCYSYNNWSCGACYRACPLAGVAMTIGRWERPTIHPEFCVGCGGCERACIRYPHAVRVKNRSV